MCNMARLPLSPPIESPHTGGVNVTRSFSLFLRAINLSPRTQETYLEAVAQFMAFLNDRGMPTAPGNIKREHVESFIVFLLADRGLPSHCE